MRPVRRTDSAVHIPVLRTAIQKQLDISPGLVVVDATIGAGGHSFDILERLTPDGILIGIDRDPMMLDLARRRLQSSPHFDSHRHHLIQGSYVDLPAILEDLQLAHVDRVLADLGLSSDQLADDERGFGFQSTGPLDLRFDPSTGEPAYVLLRQRSAEDLAGIFREFGEERHSRAIAEQIVSQRRQTPVQSVEELVAVVETVVGNRRPGQSHPATRIFQALRIAVNRELEHVSRFVNDILPECVCSGGRLGIISFHSLEDRIVKNALRRKEFWDLVNKKPITATPAEQRNNPRSRSAKLRVAIRT